LALASCAATQPREAKPSGFLRDYSQLRQGESGQALLVYVSPEADFAKYAKILIDPVTIWHDASTERIPPSEAQILADNLDDSLRLALDGDYDLVEQPGPDVMRLRVAITEAEGSWHVQDALGSKLDPELRAALPKQPSGETKGFVGKAGIEAEMLDSTTGVRLLAAVDRQAGARRLRPDQGSWDDVEAAFDYWTERLRMRLAELRGRAVGRP
jgi:hypothetical protein